MFRSYRIIDANLNRAAEGLRVVEDIARFYFDSQRFTEKLKIFRHHLRKKMSDLNPKLISSRDSKNDIGLTVSRQTRLDDKKNCLDLVNSNFKRIQEALRTIEENLKIVSQYKKSKSIEKLRFEIYTVEKQFASLFINKLPKGIYGIISEKYSKGKANPSVVKEMINGGIKIIQYSEKQNQKSFKIMYDECLKIRELTLEQGVVFIINDYLELAMLVDADGVHVGQDDISVENARKVVGNKIIGVSTRTPKEARHAEKSGADYITAGPVFKDDPQKKEDKGAGLKYLEYAIQNTGLPVVAKGGINEYNLTRVLGKGAKIVALAGEITGAPDICNRLKQLKEMMSYGLNG